MMPYFVPTRFVWRFGGKQVRLLRRSEVFRSPLLFLNAPPHLVACVLQACICLV